MELIVNYVLLFVSGAAFIYCFVLAKRLKRLNDTKDGIGASILEMTTALSHTQQTLRLARQASIEGIDRLTALIEDAENKIPEIAELISALEEMSEIALEDLDVATKRGLSAIDERTDEAIEIVAMLDLAPKPNGRRPSSKKAA